MRWGATAATTPLRATSRAVRAGYARSHAGGARIVSRLSRRTRTRLRRRRVGVGGRRARSRTRRTRRRRRRGGPSRTEQRRGATRVPRGKVGTVAWVLVEDAPPFDAAARPTRRRATSGRARAPPSRRRVGGRPPGARRGGRGGARARPRRGAPPRTPPWRRDTRAREGVEGVAGGEGRGDSSALEENVGPRRGVDAKRPEDRPGDARADEPTRGVVEKQREEHHVETRERHGSPRRAASWRGRKPRRGRSQERNRLG